MTKQELIKEYYYYKNIVDALESKISEVPKGTLRISVDKNKVRYYHCLDDNKGTQNYIHVGEMNIAKALAQKSYEEKLLKLAQKRQAQINRVLKDFDDHEVDKLYDDLHPARKKLFSPMKRTIEQKYNEWIALEYQGKEFQEGTPVILSEKGERVRSKTEKIMADIPANSDCDLIIFKENIRCYFSLLKILLTLKTLSLLQVSFSLKFPLCYIFP